MARRHLGLTPGTRPGPGPLSAEGPGPGRVRA
ncbi:hypothetical protein SFR_1350 [Streptomyces sp. FR-008]|nr:hypothetical protein SFR_1350 [Streptomyces sp. FR-008]